MNPDPQGGRLRARGPYSHDTLPPGRVRRHRADDGPSLFDSPSNAEVGTRNAELNSHPIPTSAFPLPSSPEPSPPSHAYLTGTLRLTATLDWIEYAVLPLPGPAAYGCARAWRLEAPDCDPWYVGELEDPEDPRGACEPRHRGLWCSCRIFAEHSGCGHVADLAAAGLLRPDLTDWEDLDDAVHADLGGWALNDRDDLDAEGGAH